MSNTLLVGYGRRCINPKESVPLAGYGNTTSRMSQKVLNDIYTTCIAFSGGEETVLIFHNDLLMTQQRVFDPIRKAIAEAVGLSFDRVLVCATHTHSAPDVGSGHASIARYVPFMQEQMLESAREALADRKPAAIAISNAKTKNMSYVRHYILEDGSYKGVNLNVYNPSPIAYHSSEPDPHMQLVRFIREGCKDVVVANWQAHPHLTGFGKADLSSDVIGVMRDELEAALDCSFAYFTGGSGNINILSFDTKENIFANYLSHGKELARYALEAMKHETTVEAGPVRCCEYVAKEPLNITDGSRLEEARDVKEFWVKNGNYKESLLYAESKGFHSQYHASLMLLCQELYDEGVRFREIPMYAFSVGDVAFVTAAYEMFDTNGKYIRDFSPFKATIVATCANGYTSYIPSAYGYLNDCYEADTALVIPGAGERLAQKYVKMLESMKD